MSAAATKVQRCEIPRLGGGWLRLEADDEVVVIGTSDRRVVDALYLSRHDMQALVETWLGWNGLCAVPVAAIGKD